VVHSIRRRHPTYWADVAEKRARLVMAEAEVGVQLNRRTRFGNFFVRSALEGQMFTDVGEHVGYGLGLFGWNVGAGVSR